MSSKFNKEIQDRISEIDKILSDPSLTEEERDRYNVLKWVIWKKGIREISEELECPVCKQKLDKPFLGCKYCGWILRVELPIGDPIKEKMVYKKLEVRQKYQGKMRFLEKNKTWNRVLLAFLGEMESLLMNQIDIEEMIDEFLKLSESIVKNQENINRTMGSILDTIIDNLK